jgi:hypothetical protein
MPSRRTTLLLACLALLPLLAAVGCRPQNAYIRVPEYHLTTPATQLTQQQMGQAIRLGCLAAGWGVVNEAAGQTLCQVISGGHDATVAIAYDGAHYIIEHYESSPGVGYDGETIHHRYNFWVDRLDRNIKAEIAKIHGAGPTQ